MDAAEQAALLNFFQEPVLIVGSSGTVLAANTAARRLLGASLPGQQLSDLLTSSTEAFLAWLHQCSGTATPILGAFELRLPDASTVRFKAYGARLPMLEGSAQIAIRLLASRVDEFSELTRKIGELNAEIHRRRHVQASLEEALRDNQLLMRELHHRVKNNIQMMVGLFSTTERETSSPEAKQVLQNASSRLLAIGAAQQLMYQSAEMKTISVGPFLRALCDAISASFGPRVSITLSADDGALSNELAFPLALIVNELLTNAVKHAIRGRDGTISVRLTRERSEYTLEVQDDGPGIPIDHAGKRSSGLGLIRGLCRQIGASLSIENSRGARIIIRFTGEAEREVLQ